MKANSTQAVRLGDAQLCPVCNGTGKATNNQCHGCQGIGWIVIWRDLAPVIKSIPAIKSMLSPDGSNPYADTESPLFAHGPPPPILHEGCPPGCHTGKHTHHTTVPWLYGDPYKHTCTRCGYAAGGLSFGMKGIIYLCDCCWEEWGQIYKSSRIEKFIFEGGKG